MRRVSREIGLARRLTGASAQPRSRPALPMIGATPRPRGAHDDRDRNGIRRAAAEVGATHARMVEQLADDPDTLLEAHRWILSILQVAADVNLWADTARPRFVEIVGPYKKWGGDNADAFYCYAPIDPARTYRVTGRAG